MRCAHSSDLRRFISQTLCFSLLLQTTGIAAALPLPPEKTFLTENELAADSAGSRTVPAPVDRWSAVPDLLEDVRAQVGDGAEALKSWWRDFATPPWGNSSEEPRQIAQLGGSHPLPTWLMAAVFAATPSSQSSPPGPGALREGERPSVSESELAFLAEKVATAAIPLLPGFNLISLPEEPADTDPAVVFAALGGQLEKVVAHDACDTADPKKVYDPADPAGSDLTAVDHRMGLWVAPTAATVLPSDGTLPASTTIDLCVGWNLIGFPAGESRHPLTALSSIAGKWERIFGFNAFNSEDSWEGFDPNVPNWANNLPLMQPGRGYWLLVTEATTLRIHNQGPPPTVAISTPADLAVVTQRTDIIGTVDSDRLESWTLRYRAIGEGDAVTLATGNTPAFGASLGTFDPTLLLNGLYELELTATDLQGQQVTESVAVAVEGQMKIGHFTVSFVDLAVPVSGLDIEVIRTYDSRDQRQGDFGIGWSLDIRQGSYRNNRPPGDGWQLQTGFLPCDTVLESKSHLTVIRLSDQEVYRFALQLADGAATQGGCFATARFDFIDGPLPGTTLEIPGNTSVFYENGGDRALDAESFEVYEPQDVLLTTRDGRIFELDLAAGVTRLEDLNGNELQVTPAGITQSSGRGIAFERDTQGRIGIITDPLGRSMTYTYDTSGDLISLTDRAAGVSRFSYDANHLLLDIEDPRGVKAIRNEYDAAGRLVRHIDAFGKVTELGHDQENRREVVTNRLGASRVLEYDARGNVIRETDELGKVTTRVFDGRDNLLSETDPLDRTTTYTYTANDDLATLTDSLGNKTSFTYNIRGQVLTLTNPRGGVSAHAYDSRGNLIQTTDALGSVTAFTYDTTGNLLRVADALGQLTSFEYDVFANLTKEIDALGNTIVSSYDAAGNRLTETRSRTLPDTTTETLVTALSYDSLDRVTNVTSADGSTASLTYDSVDKLTQRSDALGRVTTMTYDLEGNLVSVAYPDGTGVAQSYDDGGRLVGQVDRAGRTTTFVYDSADRWVSTTYSDGASISRLYDDADQLVATTDARGHTARYEYDGAGRRTAVIDPLSNGTTSAYDASGNRTAITDPRGNTTTFTYDALNRLTTTTHPDGTTAVLTYDALDRRTTETDPAGATTEFTYDSLSRLTRVKNALEQSTSYTYDEVGNRLTQTDANGHTTRFEYESLGRQVARIWPDGARESMVYNADGTLASHTDFAGVTRAFEYDANQRLTRRSYSDGSEVTFTYIPTGRRATVTDGRGTTTYSYDSRDRLTEKVDPTGHKLSYTYDSQGNRISLTALVGADVFATTYAYDAASRLATVTDSQGGVTSLAYDLNGNRASLASPNSARTEYTYDALNRLTNLTTMNGLGDVLQGYAYTLGAAGHRTRIDEHDGTSRSYAYDALHRLTQDRVSDPADALVYERDFSYDSVGNRLAEVIDEGSGAGVTNSTYDTRDRLLTASNQSFDWDTNGNLTGKNDGGTIAYEWDFENRLTSVTLDDATVVETTYDVDGNRTRTAVTPPGGPATVVDYLVDTDGALSHVVADIVGSSVQTLYSRADDELIGLYRPGSGISKVYHGDGLGSIRLLSDENGEVTDTYTYSAFGELLDHLGSDVQQYRFAGEPFDPAIGLSYNRRRWLDLNAGRFVSVDPFAGDLQQPASLHRYLYSAANPVNAVDPSGLTSLLSFSISSAVRGVVGVARSSIVPIYHRIGQRLGLAALRYYANAARIEVALGIVTASSLLVDKALTVFIQNTEPVPNPQNPDLVGVWGEEKLKLNATHMRVVDDISDDGHVTSMKAMTATDDRMVEQIETEAKKLGRKKRGHLKNRRGLSPRTLYPAERISGRTMIRLIPWNHLRTMDQNTLMRLREVAIRTQVHIQVVPVRRWVFRR